MRHQHIIFIALGILMAVSVSQSSKSSVTSKLTQHGKTWLNARENARAMGQAIKGNLKSFDANIFIDNVLQLANDMILAKHLDPYEIAESEFLGVHYDAWIGGYSSMVRIGDASVIHADNTLDITVQVQMTNLAGNFSFWFDILGVTISGGATATIENVDVKLALRFIKDPVSGVITPFVDDFQITDIGFIDISVFGLGPFDYLADLIAEFFVNLVKELIPLLLNDIVQNIIQEVLDNIFAHLV